MKLNKSEAEYKTINVPKTVECNRCQFYKRIRHGLADCVIVEGVVDSEATCLWFQKIKRKK